MYLDGSDCTCALRWCLLETLKRFFDPLKDAYPKAPSIPLILDQGPTSKDTQKSAKESGH
ncbi:hypothetical protein [Holospora undulata]|uniref:hypothetical protein n=1 Tax=Holospora undulata TaxID=1169117 RepID=UPI001F2A70D7|nr:hypothetical protein [Holospora undulata]